LESKEGECAGLLNPTELKMIFGHLPPIYEVHREMLADLKKAAATWRDDTTQVGPILLKYVSRTRIELFGWKKPFLHSRRDIYKWIEHKKFSLYIPYLNVLRAYGPRNQLISIGGGGDVCCQSDGVKVDLSVLKFYLLLDIK
jgi:hypothetical protein